MNPSMMKLLIERLAKERFYEMIFVLLMVHRNAGFMDGVFKTMLLETVLAGWKGKIRRKDQFDRFVIVMKGEEKWISAIYYRGQA